MAGVLVAVCHSQMCRPVLGIDLKGSDQPAQGLLLLAIAQTNERRFVAQGRIFRRSGHGGVYCWRQ